MGVKLGTFAEFEIFNTPEGFTQAAVDASPIIAGFLKKRFGKPGSAVDSTGRIISHLYGILYRTLYLLENNIFPIYCFDGVPVGKSGGADGMRKNFGILYKKYTEAVNSGNKITARTIASLPEFIWYNAVMETRRLVYAMGLPFINAPEEAEAQCSYLVKKGLCDFAVTTDYDILLYGCPSTVRITSRGRAKKTEILKLDRLLENMGIDRFMLIDLSILIGNDYFGGIKGIGPKRGLALIKKYGNIENIREALSSGDSGLPDNFPSDETVFFIRRKFLFPTVVSLDALPGTGYPRRGAILDLLCGDHTLARSRVSRAVDRLVKLFDRLPF